MKNIDINFEAFIDDLPDVMDEYQFKELLAKKSSVTRLYYNRAKNLILKGLLTSARDTRKISGNKMLLGGSYNIDCKSSESRIFLLDNGMIKLLWLGNSHDYSHAWQYTRDTWLV
jgi:hypothetical protein